MDLPVTTTKTAAKMATSIASAAASTSSTPSATGMGGHGGAMGGGMSHGMNHGAAMGGCKISMLWNWNVEDACFISRSWHVTSKAMFAGSCLGAICLVIALELLRRSVKEYDRFLIKQHAAKYQMDSGLPGSRSSSTKNIAAPLSSGEGDEQGHQRQGGVLAEAPTAAAPPAGTSSTIEVVPSFRPSIAQQAIRALLHTMQFAVAYFIMLLAMYYNGYIIISIFIGAYLGSFIFHWEPLTSGHTSAANEATVCCA